MSARFIPASVVVLAGAMLAAGCPPQLGDYTIVPAPPRSDAGMDDAGMDAGPPGTEALPALGAPCVSPYLAVAVRSTGDHLGQVRRYNLPDVSDCRETALGRENGAFGKDVYSVTGLPGGAEALGLGDGALHLDGEGFPEWRTTLDNMGGHALDMAPVALGGTPYLVVGHTTSRSSGTEGLHILGLDGRPESHIEQITTSLPFLSFAAGPAGSDTILVAQKWGQVQRVDLSLGLERLTEGVEIFTDEPDDFGLLSAIDVNPDTGRIYLAFAEALMVLSPSGAREVGPVRCADSVPCGNMWGVTYDPNGDDTILALCSDVDDGGIHHLIRASGSAGSCTLEVDGRTFDRRQMMELAVIRP